MTAISQTWQESMLLVIKLENAPELVQRNLGLWLQEVGTELYIGRVSPKTRHSLWQEITETLTDGRAIMFWQADNEQGYELETHGQPKGFLVQRENHWFTGFSRQTK